MALITYEYTLTRYLKSVFIIMLGTYMYHVLSIHVLCLPPFPPLTLPVADSNQELYFTNLNSIQLLRDGSTPEVVIDHLELAEALDCNICDSRIYWVDEVGKIKRADPSEGVEEVVGRSPKWVWLVLGCSQVTI